MSHISIYKEIQVLLNERREQLVYSFSGLAQSDSL